ncbi:MAG: alpha-N-arabinofuranosidase [Lentisphaerales bacterium]|nr:MAG: alpha-N-arabinofuranosidase [Lentisphaerales bacterium]
MKQTTIQLHTGFNIGQVDPRIFGGFLEHLGRAVYEGVYEPSSTLADPNGFRTDVLNSLKRLKMTAMRYPGGNFASGYHWLDGVGPGEKRPVARDLAWNSIEPNRFGTDEFIRLSREMDWIPMLTANLGTGTPEEAGNWVEYCNCPTGTRYADMRAANGYDQPHDVKLWCLGNEMDGPWQLGHVPARDYAIRAQQAAKIMKDTSDFLASSASIDRQIEEMDAACRFVQARRRSAKRTCLCFDEWNVSCDLSDSGSGCRFAPHLGEGIFTLQDALVAGGFLHSFIRHADVLKIANLAQIVNVLAPILTRGDDMLLQSIFYPFEMFSKRREGISLMLSADGPTYDSDSYGTVPVIDSSAILNDGLLNVFVTNRSIDRSAEVTIRMADRSVASIESAQILTGPNPRSANTFEQRDIVKSQPFAEAVVRNGEAVAELPHLSLVALTLKLT